MQPSPSDNIEKDDLNEETPEVSVEQDQESVPTPEVLEQLQESGQDQVEHQKIRTQIEDMDLDDHLKLQVQADADSVAGQDAKQILKNLLQMANTKGVVFAVHVAKKINDPYILDAFHDALAQEGYYKEFTK